MERLFCVLIGYAFGCFLTAELVAWRCAGKPCAEIGTGNPGMANLMTELGFWPGVAVLAGDTAKTATACIISAWLFPALGLRLAALYAGFGAALGHNFPLWKKFRGGKGVAVTCMALIIASPLWGTLSNIAGMLVVFSTGWLPLGAVVIPAAYTALAFWRYGPETGVLALALALLMLGRHSDGLKRMAAGTEPRKAWLFHRKGPDGGKAGADKSARE